MVKKPFFFTDILSFLNAEISRKFCCNFNQNTPKNLRTSLQISKRSQRKDMVFYSHKSIKFNGSSSIDQ